MRVPKKSRGLPMALVYCSGCVFSHGHLDLGFLGRFSSHSLESCSERGGIVLDLETVDVKAHHCSHGQQQQQYNYDCSYPPSTNTVVVRSGNSGSGWCWGCSGGGGCRGRNGVRCCAGCGGGRSGVGGCRGSHGAGGRRGGCSWRGCCHCGCRGCGRSGRGGRHSRGRGRGSCLRWSGWSWLWWSSSSQ